MTVLARLNDLELRIATRPRELAAAQALRYRVFYEELGAQPDEATRRRRRDVDPFDAFADHLLVVDRARSTSVRPCVVGCYRIVRESVANRNGGLYTAAEFDLSGLTQRDGELMELGRSCVDVEYRTGAVMALLWKGVADYLNRFQCELMIGCGSLPGTDVAAAAPLLRYLSDHHLAPEGLRPRALPERAAVVDLAAAPLDPREALRRLPPLLKAYLRMGGMVGEGAVIDDQFNTIDVCIVLPTKAVASRYERHCRLHLRTSMDAAA